MVLDGMLNFQMMLSAILLSMMMMMIMMMMILLSTLSVIRYLICGNN